MMFAIFRKGNILYNLESLAFSWQNQHLLFSTNASAQRHPNGFWKDKNNQRKVLDAIGRVLNVKEKQDWMSVTTSQVRQRGGGSLLNLYQGSLIRTLQNLYSE